MHFDLKSTFKALSIRSYRLFFIGQGISLIGTWMQRATMSWFVYRITGSAFLIGVMSFLSMVPSIVISPFAGQWGDRWHRHYIIILTQTAAFLQAAALALVVLNQVVHSGFILPLIVLSLMQGVIDAVDSPVRQSFVFDLVESKTMLPNAIAMNSAMFNGARLVGPTLAGMLIVALGEGYCFAINSLSYIPVIVMLIMIRINAKPRKKENASTLSNIAQGWKYAFGSFPIRFLISNIVIFTLFGMSYATLLPVFAKDILGGDSRTLGYMMSLVGVGALSGALYLASRKSLRGLGPVMIGAGVLVSICLIVFSLSQWLVLSLPLMLVIGLGLMMQTAGSNTILQSIIADEMRGRVLSLYTMSFMSVAPFGNLLAGFLSSRFGARYTLMGSASICLLWTVFGLNLIPKFIRSVNRMLIVNRNQAMYRPAGYVLPLRTVQK